MIEIDFEHRKSIQIDCDKVIEPIIVADKSLTRIERMKLSFEWQFYYRGANRKNSKVSHA
jgi:hypothetical protein